jgi:tRNA threonylcarbamoyladenosine biosynthesis protein TsaB
MATPPRLLILETSCRRGGVGLALGATLLGRRTLDQARRHTRDLAPTVRELLAAQGWSARQIDGVLVGLGPGSYTGLRVGVMSAKTFAYASGCRLLGVPSFHTLAAQVQADAIAVLADAQQDNVYLQNFTRSGDLAHQRDSLRIVPFEQAMNALAAGTLVTGPGLEGKGERVPDRLRVAPEAAWQPDVESALRIGLARYERDEHDDPIALEPLYLRPSSAEEKWERRH